MQIIKVVTRNLVKHKHLCQPKLLNVTSTLYYTTSKGEFNDIFIKEKRRLTKVELRRRFAISAGLPAKGSGGCVLGA